VIAEGSRRYYGRLIFEIQIGSCSKRGTEGVESEKTMTYGHMKSDRGVAGLVFGFKILILHLFSVLCFSFAIIPLKSSP
jgi:hypothetical protein